VGKNSFSVFLGHSTFEGSNWIEPYEDSSGDKVIYVKALYCNRLWTDPCKPLMNVVLQC